MCLSSAQLRVGPLLGALGRAGDGRTSAAIHPPSNNSNTPSSSKFKHNNNVRLGTLRCSRCLCAILSTLKKDTHPFQISASFQWEPLNRLCDPIYCSTLDSAFLNTPLGCGIYRRMRSRATEVWFKASGENESTPSRRRRSTRLTDDPFLRRCSKSVKTNSVCSYRMQISDSHLHFRMCVAQWIRNKPR